MHLIIYVSKNNARRKWLSLIYSIKISVVNSKFTKLIFDCFFLSQKHISVKKKFHDLVSGSIILEDGSGNIILQDSSGNIIL